MLSAFVSAVYSDAGVEFLNATSDCPRTTVVKGNRQYQNKPVFKLHILYVIPLPALSSTSTKILQSSKCFCCFFRSEKSASGQEVGTSLEHSYGKYIFLYIYEGKSNVKFGNALMKETLKTKC